MVELESVRVAVIVGDELTEIVSFWLIVTLFILMDTVLTLEFIWTVNVVSDTSPFSAVTLM